jgi:hypothetical protein
MASTYIVPPALAESWKKKTMKQHLQSSPWDQLSNQSTHNHTVPNSSEKRIPTTIVNKVSDTFDEGQYRTTCLWVGKPNVAVTSGPNKAEGKEARRTTKMFSCHYNVQRFPMVVSDNSVEGNASKFYKLAEGVAMTISDLFVEQTDYDCEKALLEGADNELCDPNAWENADNPSNINHPVDETLHPNMYSDATTTKVTWSATYSTAETNLQADIDNLASTNIFDFAALDRIHLIASRTVAPVPGGKEYKWVLKISDAQWFQISTETTTNNSIRDLFKHTEKGYEKMIDGCKGVYLDMLIVVSQRNAIWDVAGTAGLRAKYYTPASDTRTRAQTTGAGTADGTAEVAALMGNGALSQAIISETSYVKKGFDYDFSDGMTGMRARGTQRTDIDATVAATSARINESSFLYFTATTTNTI